MSRHPSHRSGSDYDESIHSLKHLSQELMSLQLWDNKRHEKIEREAQLAILEEEIRVLRLKNEKIHKKA